MCSTVLFDLVVEREPFLEGISSLEEVIESFFHLCFVANMEYPKVNQFVLKVPVPSVAEPEPSKLTSLEPEPSKTEDSTTLPVPVPIL